MRLGSLGEVIYGFFVMLKNIITLYVIYVAKLLFPLFLLPILSIRLSQSAYGLYMYSISVSMWLGIFVEYGFNIYSTREIASGKRNDSPRVIVGTQSARVLLSILLLPICLLLSSQLHIFKGHEFWAFISWLVAVCIGFSPVYYYQAVENLKSLAFVELLSSGALLFLVIGVVRGDQDLNLLGVFLCITRFLSVIFVTWLMLQEENIGWSKIFDFKMGCQYIKKAFHFFIFQAAVSLYTSFNVVLLGVLKSPIEVGQYASAERLIKAGLGSIGLTTQAIFPRLNKIKTLGESGINKLRRYTLFAMLFIGIGGMTFALIFSKFITSVLFPQDAGSITAIINILSFVIPAVALSNFLGFQYLVVDNMEKSFNKIIIFSAFLNIGTSYFMIVHYGIRGLAIGWVTIEWLITAMIALKIWSNKLAVKTNLGK